MIHDELHGEHRSRPLIGVSLCWSAGRVLTDLKAAQSSNALMAVSMKAVAFYKPKLFGVAKTWIEWTHGRGGPYPFVHFRRFLDD